MPHFTETFFSFCSTIYKKIQERLIFLNNRSSIKFNDLLIKIRTCDQLMKIRSSHQFAEIRTGY